MHNAWKRWEGCLAVQRCLGFWTRSWLRVPTAGSGRTETCPGTPSDSSKDLRRIQRRDYIYWCTARKKKEPKKNKNLCQTRIVIIHAVYALSNNTLHVSTLTIVLLSCSNEFKHFRKMTSTPSVEGEALIFTGFLCVVWWVDDCRGWAVSRAGQSRGPSYFLLA